MNLERITIVPDLCGGEPTIRGMRITVSQVLELLAGGMKPEEILQDFPYLEQADIAVDRNAVHYEQLWSTLPDGGSARIYYGNNTWNPTGIWEARAIPGSSRIMATAAPHHGMSAGSVILVDVNRGVDGKEPLTRLT